MHVYVTKRFTFEASHILTLHPGKCSQLHGHSYKLFVTVTAKSEVGHEAIIASMDAHERGYFVDFADLSMYIGWWIETHDHKHLNDLSCMKGKQATVENLAMCAWGNLSTVLDEHDLVLHEIKLYETENCYVTVTRQ